MNASELRQRFLDFFEERGHTVVASSSLVPKDDATLLFTNAGMVQFKRTFLGAEERAYKRAVTSQKCVRAGGKHNDLEEVGRTARHHTFFEMLGNFSFGDYFKRDAIRFAWDFLVGELGLDPDRMYATVHHTDDEAAGLWEEVVNLPSDRIYRLGDKDNWSSGTSCSCSLIEMKRESFILCPRRPSTPGRGSSASPRCSRGCPRTITRTCFFPSWNGWGRSEGGGRK